MSTAVLLAPLVSLIISDEAVPALVSANDVGVLSPDESVTERSLASLVAIVLPLL